MKGFVQPAEVPRCLCAKQSLLGSQFAGFTWNSILNYMFHLDVKIALFSQRFFLKVLFEKLPQIYPCVKVPSAISQVT